MKDKLIRISEDVKLGLDEVGNTNQSYGDVVEMLLQFYCERNTVESNK